MDIIYDTNCAEYKLSGHPEAPERVSETAEFLKKHKYQFVTPKIAEEKDIFTYKCPLQDR